MSEIRHTIERARISGTRQPIHRGVTLVYDPNRTQTVVLHGGVIAEPIPRWILEGAVDRPVEESTATRSYTGRSLIAGNVEITVTERVSSGLATVVATINRAAVKAFIQACADEDWARIELATAGAA